MYWPSGSARRLCASPAGLETDEDVVHVETVRHGSLWLALTRSTVIVGRARPSEIIAATVRTPRSLRDYGDNVRAVWRPDANEIVVHVRDTAARDTLLWYEVVQPSDAPSSHAVVDVHASGWAPTPAALMGAFQPGTGEGYHAPQGEPLGARLGLGLQFRRAVHIAPGVSAMAALDDALLIGTRSPEAVQLMPWQGIEARAGHTHAPVLLSSLPWWPPSAALAHVEYSHAIDMAAWMASDGSVYLVGGAAPVWHGSCAYRAPGHAHARAVAVALNARFRLLAVGLDDGRVGMYELTAPDEPTRALPEVPSASPRAGRVTSLAWSSDGLALAVGYEHGWSLVSALGYTLCHSFRDDWATSTRVFRDTFSHGVRSVAWGVQSSELLLVPGPSEAPRDAVVFLLPLVRAAAASHMTPDVGGAGVLLSDDSVFLYRGLELSDEGLLSNEPDAWRHVRLPAVYLASQWPIRYATQSADGQFLAVAGRRGLAHFSTRSGRWKLYEVPAQALAFSVRGGMAWFQHVLVAACDCGGEMQLRLYSRDQPLDNAHLLDLVKLSAPVVTLQMHGPDLLLYLADNTLAHYVITPTRHQLRAHLCGTLSFDGIMGEPARVRACSWARPPVHESWALPASSPAQPAQRDALGEADLVFLIDGMLVLLRHAAHATAEDASYDMHVLHEHIEQYWMGPSSDADALAGTLWGYDGQQMQVWLDLGAPADAMPTLTLPAHAYPLCLLPERGVVVGVESHMVVRRTLDTADYRTAAHVSLFVPALARHFLAHHEFERTLALVSTYAGLTYFSHMLEMLVHLVLEEEAPSPPPDDQRVLPSVMRLLDYFDVALQVVARVARKSEAKWWPYLFEAAGAPKALLQRCLDRNDVTTAAALLIVVYEIHDAPTSAELAAALLVALDHDASYGLLREVLSFLQDLDDDGARVRAVLEDAVRRAPSAGLLQEALPAITHGAQPTDDAEAAASSDAAHGVRQDDHITDTAPADDPHENDATLPDDSAPAPATSDASVADDTSEASASSLTAALAGLTTDKPTSLEAAGHPQHADVSFVVTDVDRNDEPSTLDHGRPEALEPPSDAAPALSELEGPSRRTSRSTRKMGLGGHVPRRPSSISRAPEDRAVSEAPPGPSSSASPLPRTSSAHVMLHRAARHASLTLSPSRPRMQANGRLVLDPPAPPTPTRYASDKAPLSSL